MSQPIYASEFPHMQSGLKLVKMLNIWLWYVQTKTKIGQNVTTLGHEMFKQMTKTGQNVTTLGCDMFGPRLKLDKMLQNLVMICSEKD